MEILLAITLVSQAILFSFTAVSFAAPARRIWTVLTDFPRYPEWNRFLLEVLTHEMQAEYLAFMKPAVYAKTFGFPQAA